MNPISLDRKNSLESNPIQSMGLDMEWNPKKIESPFLKMVQNLDMGNSEPNRYGYFNQDSFRPVENNYSPAEFEPAQAGHIADSKPTESNESKQDEMKEFEEELEEAKKKKESTEHYLAWNVDSSRNPSEAQSKAQSNHESEPSENLSAVDKNSNKKKEASVDSNSAMESQSKKGNENGMGKSQDGDGIKNQNAKNGIDNFEKKILTTKDLWEKITGQLKSDENKDSQELTKADRFTEKDSNPKLKNFLDSNGEKKSEGVGLDGEVAGKKKATDGKKLSQDSSGGNSIQEGLTGEKSEMESKPLADKQRVAKQSTESTEFLTDKNADKKTESLTTDKEASTAIRNHKSGIPDKQENGEQKEMSRWDIQKEKIRIENRSGSGNSNNTSTASKEGISSMANAGNSSGQGNFDQSSGGRDSQDGGFRSDFLRNLTSRGRDVERSATPGMSAEDKKQNLDRLVKSAKIQIINQGRSQAEIRMNPQDLGRMILKISVNQDKVEGRILVESESLKSSLQSDMAQLKEDLRGQGLQLESLEIDVDLDHNSNFGEKKQGFAWEKGIHKESLESSDIQSTQRVLNSNENSLLDVVA